MIRLYTRIVDLFKCNSNIFTYVLADFKIASRNDEDYIVFRHGAETSSGIWAPLTPST